MEPCAHLESALKHGRLLAKESFDEQRTKQQSGDVSYCARDNRHVARRKRSGSSTVAADTETTRQRKARYSGELCRGQPLPSQRYPKLEGSHADKTVRASGAPRESSSEHGQQSSEKPLIVGSFLRRSGLAAEAAALGSLRLPAYGKGGSPPPRPGPHRYNPEEFLTIVGGCSVIAESRKRVWRRSGLSSPINRVHMLAKDGSPR